MTSSSIRNSPLPFKSKTGRTQLMLPTTLVFCFTYSLLLLWVGIIVAYALLFASRGAKVVVNDLGGDPHGRGSAQKAADIVVNEIKQAGGSATADYNSVTDGEKIIQTAVDNYGRVDILVNNAGILRDRSLPKISEDDWDAIQNVHLKGSFKTTQAAFPIMKKQGYGRIIMTSSGSGLYGNFGQANYSAAKMGVVGLANTIAIEGGAKNVYCNVIVPTAASRLTKDVLPPELFQELKPELIAPVVAYLCHDSCSENGTIIESAAGWAGKSQIFRSKGGLIRKHITESGSIENVRNKWSDITDMTTASPRGSLPAALADLTETMECLRNGTEKPTGSSREDDIFTFASKDLILYALGVGASVQNSDELKLLYENHEEFGPLPTFYILPGMLSLMSSSRELAIPGKTLSLENTLHGEQYLEIYNSPPEAGSFLTNTKIVETLDKGSGAAIVLDSNSYNEQGGLIMRNQCVTFIVGAGNFGGSRTGKQIVPCLPKPDRKPDVSLTYKTSIDQAALYRLSGDVNPMHIDPNFAAIAGYEKPILHGLCTLGISVRLVMATFASYDVKLFKAVKARFSKVVLPGQTLRVDMWRNGNRVHFETAVVENNTIAITGAYVDLKTIKERIMPNKVISSLKSDAIFEYIIDQVKVQPDKAKSVNGIFLIKITKDGEIVKEWTLDLKTASIYEGSGKDVKHNTTLTVSDDDFVEMAVGKLNPQQAFMKGKLKASGNIMLAQKLGPLLKAAPKL